MITKQEQYKAALYCRLSQDDKQSKVHKEKNIIVRPQTYSKS